MLQRGGATRSIQQRDSCSVAAAVVKSRCCNVAAQNPSSSRRSKHPAEQNPCVRGSKSSEICADEVNFCLQSLKDFSTVRTYFQEDRRRRSGCEKNLVQPFLFQSLRSMELKDSTERLDVKIFNP